MIGAELAANVLNSVFNHSHFNEEILNQYDKLWKVKLALEIRTGLKLRKIYSYMIDSHINLLFGTISRKGITPLRRENLNFGWHKGLIFFLIENSIINRLLSSKFQSVTEKHQFALHL